MTANAGRVRLTAETVCTGVARSPGIVPGGAATSRVSNRDRPVSRSKRYRDPDRLGKATASTVVPAHEYLDEGGRCSELPAPETVPDGLTVPAQFPGPGVEGQQRVRQEAAGQRGPARDAPGSVARWVRTGAHARGRVPCQCRRTCRWGTARRGSPFRHRRPPRSLPSGAFRELQAEHEQLLEGDGWRRRAHLDPAREHTQIESPSDAETGHGSAAGRIEGQPARARRCRRAGRLRCLSHQVSPRCMPPAACPSRSARATLPVAASRAKALSRGVSP